MRRSAWQPESCLRTVLTIVVLTDLVWLFFLLDEAHQIGLANGALNSFNDLVSRTWIRGAIALVGVLGALAFRRGPGRLWEGVAALAALTVLNTAHAQLFGSPWRHLFFSGLCLSGWLLGLGVSRRQGAPGDESYARTGSLALLSAAYFNAGISKFVYGGIDWLSGVPIQATIVAQDGLVRDSVLSSYRAWVVYTPWAASFFSFATVAFELGAPLMLVGRRTRACVALGLFAMHANIFGLTAILYAESMVLLLAFGLLPEPTRQAIDPTAPSRSGGRLFTVAAGVLGVCAVLAVWHQARRYAQSQAGEPSARSVPSAPPTVTEMPLLPTATAVRLHAVGPLAVGQRVADGWTVAALDLSDGGVVATLSGPRGQVALELTCAATPYRSPFDLGPAHIFYSGALAFDDLRPAGAAVQRIVQHASAGGNVCAKLAEWRMAAR